MSRPLSLTNTLLIKELIADGFERIADVSPASTPQRWKYENVNQFALVSHPSWIYVVCVNNRVVKLGETNLPLFLPRKGNPSEPTANGGRLGRLARGHETDKNIRAAVQPYTQQGKVFIYARQCPVHEVMRRILGEETVMPLKGNQQEEKDYLDKIKRKTGQLPPLNKSRK